MWASESQRPGRNPGCLSWQTQFPGLEKEGASSAELRAVVRIKGNHTQGNAHNLWCCDPRCLQPHLSEPPASSPVNEGSWRSE